MGWFSSTHSLLMQVLFVTVNKTSTWKQRKGKWKARFWFQPLPKSNSGCQVWSHDVKIQPVQWKILKLTFLRSFLLFSICIFFKKNKTKQPNVCVSVWSSTLKPHCSPLKFLKTVFYFLKTTKNVNKYEAFVALFTVLTSSSRMLCVCDWDKVNYRVCVHGDEGRCQLVQQWGSLMCF